MTRIGYVLTFVAMNTVLCHYSLAGDTKSYADIASHLSAVKELLNDPDLSSALENLMGTSAYDEAASIVRKGDEPFTDDGELVTGEACAQQGSDNCLTVAFSNAGKVFAVRKKMDTARLFGDPPNEVFEDVFREERLHGMAGEACGLMSVVMWSDHGVMGAPPKESLTILVDATKTFILLRKVSGDADRPVLRSRNGWTYVWTENKLVVPSRQPMTCLGD